MTDVGVLHRRTEYQIQIYLPDNQAWMPVLIKGDGESTLADFWYSDQAEAAEDARQLRNRIPVSQGAGRQQEDHHPDDRAVRTSLPW